MAQRQNKWRGVGILNKWLFVGLHFKHFYYSFTYSYKFSDKILLRKDNCICLKPTVLELQIF